eukprot:1155952-Pelagomonas_calceolata.AAC.2
MLEGLSACLHASESSNPVIIGGAATCIAVAPEWVFLGGMAGNASRSTCSQAPWKMLDLFECLKESGAATGGRDYHKQRKN